MDCTRGSTIKTIIILDNQRKEYQMLEKVISALKQLRIGKIQYEWELQKQIADVLDKNKILYQKEYKLGPKNRVDFLVEGGVAIEVKKGRIPRNRLKEQIDRYASFDEVKQIVIVMETSIQNPIVQASNGKECRMLNLFKQWGIAL